MPILATPLLLLASALAGEPTEAGAQTPPQPPQPPPLPAEAASALPTIPVYHYAGGAGQGVYTAEEISRIIASDPNGKHFLWKDGWSAWVPWQQVPEIATAAAQEAPPSTPPLEPPPPPVLAIPVTTPPLPVPETPVPLHVGSERLRLIDARVTVSNGTSFANVNTWGIAKGESQRSLSSWEFARVVGDTETMKELEQNGKAGAVLLGVGAGVCAVLALPLAADLVRGNTDVSAGEFVLGFTGAAMVPVFGLTALMAPGRAKTRILSSDYKIERATGWMNSYNDGTPPPAPEAEPEIQ